MNGGTLWQVVGDIHAHRFASGYTNRWTRGDAVVGPGFDALVDIELPIHNIAGDIEDLHITIHGEFHVFGTVAFGFGREGFHTCFVIGIHLVRRHGLTGETG